MKDDLYASHLPILSRVVDISSGPILELGIGYSTLLFHVMCKQTKRPVYSFENDEKWYRKYEDYRTDWHHVVYTNDWNAIEVPKIHWGIVFIDHRPGKDRHKQALRYMDTANFVIVHDSEPESDKWYGYSYIYKYFKYVYHYNKALPNTTVLSNFIDLKVL